MQIMIGDAAPIVPLTTKTYAGANNSTHARATSNAEAVVGVQSVPRRKREPSNHTYTIHHVDTPGSLL